MCLLDLFNGDGESRLPIDRTVSRRRSDLSGGEAQLLSRLAHDAGRFAQLACDRRTHDHCRAALNELAAGASAAAPGGVGGGDAARAAAAAPPPRALAARRLAERLSLACASLCVSKGSLSVRRRSSLSALAHATATPSASPDLPTFDRHRYGAVRHHLPEQPWSRSNQSMGCFRRRYSWPTFDAFHAKDSSRYVSFTSFRRPFPPPVSPVSMAVRRKLLLWLMRTAAEHRVFVELSALLDRCALKDVLPKWTVAFENETATAPEGLQVEVLDEGGPHNAALSLMACPFALREGVIREPPFSLGGRCLTRLKLLKRSKIFSQCVQKKKTTS